jgi:hypothetical protein
MATFALENDVDQLVGEHASDLDGIVERGAHEDLIGAVAGPELGPALADDTADASGAPFRRPAAGYSYIGRNHIAFPLEQEREAIHRFYKPGFAIHVFLLE